MINQTVKNIIYSLNKYLTCAYDMPAMVLGAGDTAIGKAKRYLKSIIIWVFVESVTIF